MKQGDNYSPLCFLLKVILAFPPSNHNCHTMIRHPATHIARFIKRFIPQSSALLLIATTLALLNGCAPTPESERMVSAKDESPVSVSPGTCDQIAGKNQRLNPVLNITGLTPEHISVLTWNIYKKNKNGWREDLRTFGAGKDLILLQEAYLDNEFQNNLDNLSAKSLYWNFNSAFSFKGVASGVMIASWISPKESCGVQEMEPLLRLPKTALISLYPVAGSTKTLMVANIHGVNFTLGTATYKKQFQTLKQLMDDHNGPIILAGDFNNWSDKRSAVINELAGSLGLTALSFEDDERTTVFNTPIDHILYRGLEVVSNDVHLVDSSDHNPITAVFRLENPLLSQYRTNHP